MSSIGGNGSSSGKRSKGGKCSNGGTSSEGGKGSNSSTSSGELSAVIVVQPLVDGRCKVYPKDSFFLS